jgi:hypothetical protein
MEAPNLTQADASLAEVWPRFSERLSAVNDRLMDEQESCWRDLQSLLDGQLQQLETASQTTLEQPGLAAFQTARAEAARLLLSEPLAQWERWRPYKRAMLALESYDRHLEELARSLPGSVSVNGPSTLEVLKQWNPQGWARRLARLRRKERTLPVENLVADELQRLSLRRAETEGRKSCQNSRDRMNKGGSWC